MRVRSAAWLAVIAMLVAGCGGTAAPAAPKATPAQGAPATSPPAGGTKQKVVLRLPYLISGYDAPFYLSQAKGYYASAGLDVSIEAGRGSSTTAQTVANGSDTFGFADAGTAAELISKGAPLKSIAVLVQKTPDGIIYSPGTTIGSGADLKGKTLITDSGSATIHLVTAVLSKAKLSKDDVKIDFIAPAGQVAAFKQHPDFLLLGVSLSTYVNVLQVDPQAKFISFADLGVNPYSFALITSQNEIDSHAQTVRDFVAASIRGWQDAQSDPKAALAAIEQADPQDKADVLARSLDMTLQLLHTPDTASKPLGWTPASGWQDMLDLLHTYGGMGTVKPLNDYYTNEFLPQS